MRIKTEDGYFTPYVEPKASKAGFPQQLTSVTFNVAYEKHSSLYVEHKLYFVQLQYNDVTVNTYKSNLAVDE